jgi:uncharacterized protein with HEPN domain
MSPRLWTERIEDILDAIAEIDAFTRSLSLEQFRNDPKTQKAVTLDIVIIGEAAAHVPEDVVHAHPEIAWSLMRAMRNRLVHDYFGVDPEVLWGTVRNDLPGLIEPLRKLLRA